MRLKITSGVNTWLIAGESQAQADGNYQSRLLNELKLAQSLTALGSAPVTLNISVRNDDGYISPAIDLWGALVEITADGGTTWSGTITAYDSDGDGVTYLVATEKAAPELTIQMPDEVARLVTVDENFHSSAVNVTLPLVFGGNTTTTHLIKGILIDKTQGIYLLCVGEIHQVVKVYRGTEEITTGFTAYTGTPGQADYAGFAYVQLSDEAIRKNDDGSYAEISADIIGLKLGSATIEECRNGARVLYYLLTTAKDGVGGWGLGIGTSDINTTAFNQAISDADAAGLKFDGIFYFRQAAQSWIDQICLAIRGAYSIGRDGKRALYINKSAASAKIYTETNMRMLRHGVGAYTGRVYNKGKLDFDYNPITGQFMQSAQFEDAVSVAAICEQEFYGQSYLIKDMATAQAIVEYTCQKSLIGARKVYFETDELPTGARSGTVITVTRPDLGITGDYQITSLEIGDHVHTVEAEKFDASIFSVGTPGIAIDWTKDAPITSPVTPGAASGLLLSTEITRSPEGTNTIAITGSFSPPDGTTMMANAEYGEGVAPVTWCNHGLIRGNSFRIAPVKHAQIYSVRVQMLTSTGHSSYVTATITTAGDTEAPAAPVVSVSGSLQLMQVLITLDDPPNDLAGFFVYRGLDDNPLNAEPVGSVVNEDGLARLIDRVYSYTDIYYYFAQAYDEWKNLSDYSLASAPVQAFKILDADILRQLTPADALNTDPYFADFSAWSSDIENASPNPDNFVEIIGGLAGKTGFKSLAGEKLIFGVNYDRLIPYDISRQYVLSAFMKSIGGGSHGLGFAFYNAAKTLIGQSESLQYAVSATETWQQFSKAITSAPEGTMFLSPMIVCNNDTTADVSLEVQKCRLREALTSDIFVANEAVITTAAQIAAAIINSAHISELDAGKIKSGVIDTARLSAQIASIMQLTVMGKNLIEDPALLDIPTSFEPDGIASEFTFGRWTIASDTVIPENAGAGAAPWVKVITHEDYPSLVDTGKGIVITPFLATNKIWIGQKVNIAANESYCFSAHIRRGLLAYGRCPECQLSIEWHGSAGYISQNAAQVSNIAGGRFFVEGIAPANALYAVLYITISAQSTSVPYNLISIISALQFERSTEGATFWVGREQGTVFADRIFTGVLKSLNWGELAGSAYDLDNGTFKLGGSENPVLSWNGISLLVKGIIEALEGIIGGFLIGPNSLTAGSGSSAVGMSINSIAFYAGSETPSDAPFHVKHDGTGRLGLLTFTATEFAHYSYDRNYDPVDPNHLIRTFAIAPNVDDWKGAAMHFQDAYGDTGCFLDSTKFVFSSFLGDAVRCMPYGAKTQTDPLLLLGSCSSTDYALATTGIIEGYINNLSDKRIKKDFLRVNTLNKLMQLDVSEWSYDEDAIYKKANEKRIEEAIKCENKIPISKIGLKICPNHRHVGPTAKEFNELFGVSGGNPESIGVGDQIGVTMRALQELATIVFEQASEIAELRKALKLPEKNKNTEDIEEAYLLTDEEREYIKLSETMSDENRAIIKAKLESKS